MLKYCKNEIICIAFIIPQRRCNDPAKAILIAARPPVMDLVAKADDDTKFFKVAIFLN